MAQTNFLIGRGELLAHDIQIKKGGAEKKAAYTLPEAREALAPQANATATYELGTLYLEGHGVPRNDSKAASLIKEAAILGYSQAQSTLGMLYEAGECGLNENQAESLEWFIKAAQQGDRKSVV